MTNIYRTILKASRLVKRRRPISAAMALQELWSPPGPKTRRKSAKTAPKPKSRGVGKPAQGRPDRAAPGSFSSGEFHCPHGALGYWLYMPPGSARRRMPLIVMLHGCTQTATDFAAGTRLNRLADELGFAVLYPQQSSKANIARCWNWHDPAHQARGGGEPAIIGALTRHAINLCRTNPTRVYIAGISAGGAAAAIIGAAYPDIYAAVGVHSGVARGNIRSLGTALTTMRGRASGPSKEKLPRQLPTIVFHGDNDSVVHPSNARGFLNNLERSQPGPLTSRSYRGCSSGGRHFTRRIHKGQDGRTLLEDWTVHGSGHSWSGGSAAASHTDPSGPDASREMVRFFMTHRRWDWRQV